MKLPSSVLKHLCWKITCNRRSSFNVYQIRINTQPLKDRAGCIFYTANAHVSWEPTWIVSEWLSDWKWECAYSRLFPASIWDGFFPNHCPNLCPNLLHIRKQQSMMRMVLGKRSPVCQSVGGDWFSYGWAGRITNYLRPTILWKRLLTPRQTILRKMWLKVPHRISREARLLNLVFSIP